jgi:hypothetical protein
MVRITVDPRLLARPALESVETVVAVGDRPAEILTVFSEILEVKPPEQLPETLKPGEALVWSRHNGPPFRIQVAPSHTQRRRHVRKYAEGELPPDRSFYFQGPEKKLNLRAQNLMLFVQLADGVDDATWLHHLGRGEYSRWFREAIKDDTLAAEAAAVEERADLAPAESRRLIRAAIEERYTLPSSPPMPMPGTDAGQ